MEKITYRPDIQKLRALSVVAVFFFHWTPNFIPNGYLGVDVFFVISGFVIYPLMERIFIKKDFKSVIINMSKFYSGRFYRLAPALGTVLSVFIILIFLFSSPDEHPNIAKQGFATLAILGNFGAYRYSGNYFNPEPNPLIHFWTLSTEEQIYIFLPLFFMVLVLIKIKIKIIYTTFPLFIFSVYVFLNKNIFSDTYAKYGIELAEQLNFYSPLSRIWEFLLGCYIHIIIKNRNFKTKVWVKKLTLVCFIGLILFPLKIDETIATFLVTVTSAFLISHKVFELKLSKKSNLLEKIGDRSYVIYLVHLPIIYLINSTLINYLKINSLVKQILILSLTIILTEIVHKKIEIKNKKIGTQKILKAKIKILVKFVFVPGFLAVFIITGSQNSYWGLDKNELKPPYAGYSDSKCERDSYNGPPCVYTANGLSRKVLLIGDSHAGHFSQAIIDAAKKANFSAVIWTHSGCRFQFAKSSNYDIHENCMKVNSDIIAYIKEEKPEIVILSQALPSGIQLNDIKNGILELNNVSKELFIIDQTPKFPDGSDFLKSKAIVKGKKRYKEYFALNDMDLTTSQQAAEIRKLANLNGITMINVNSIFCDEEKCERKRNQKWLYSDDNHLSIYGASLTVETFEKIFRMHNK